MQEKEVLGLIPFVWLKTRFGELRASVDRPDLSLDLTWLNHRPSSMIGPCCSSVWLGQVSKLLVDTAEDDEEEARAIGDGRHMDTDQRFHKRVDRNCHRIHQISLGRSTLAEDHHIPHSWSEIDITNLQAARER
jgi:hypothetical protein